MSGSSTTPTAALGSDGRLRLARGGDTLLLGASPTARAWCGEEIIPIDLMIDPAQGTVNLQHPVPRTWPPAA